MTIRLGSGGQGDRRRADRGVEVDAGGRPHGALRDPALCRRAHRQRRQPRASTAVGIEVDARGRLKVDPRTFQTSVPHIYAAGDVIGFPSLASTSMEQGRVAACHAFGMPLPPPPETFPYGIYAVPEISTVGQSEEQVRESGVAYEMRHRAVPRDLARAHHGRELRLPETDLRARHAAPARRAHRRRGCDRAHPHRPGGDQPAAARSISSSTTPSTIRRWPRPTRSPGSTPGTGWGEGRASFRTKLGALARSPRDLSVDKSGRACLPVGRRDRAPAQAGASRLPRVGLRGAPLALRKFAPGDRTGRQSTGLSSCRSGGAVAGGPSVDR